MKKSLKLLLQQSHQSRKTSGFTLTELLVGMVMASLVITPLFSFAFNIMESDRKEQAKATTEQEIQSALDYIAQDLEQAIYIYDDHALNNNWTSDPNTSGIKDQIPPVAEAIGCGSTTLTCIPVLTFWMRENMRSILPVTATSNCNSNPPTLCNDTFVYSLVGYYLIKDNNINWSNTARIGRFKIRDGVINPLNPTKTDGSSNYIKDPNSGFQLFNLVASGDTLQKKMNSWKKGDTAYGRDVRVDVLIDYIDQSTILSTSVSCPNGMRKIPSTASLQGGFYACVNSATTSAQVYIRGNALARIGNNSTFSTNQSAYFPSATIQVKGRGFLGVE